MPKQVNEATHLLSENLFPVVGVGASAGGMKAFQELVRAIPENSGMAYILIQHLAPEPESILTEILQKETTIPVLEITDNIKVMPDHIYVIPANKLVTANDGILLLAPRVKGDKVATIDLFFISLAEVHQHHSIGVVLSGTGNDGTIGLKTIKDQGGITIVQDKASAAYYDMPQSAIDAEVVDFVLQPGEIPKQLQELSRNAKIASSNFNVVEEVKEEDIFRQILALLKVKRGVDFTYYKQSTIRRRILRRKLLNRIKELNEYKNYLFENKAEQDALFNDILIPVTAFFRDPETFDVLCETVFPALFKKKTPTDPIRVWVAGCSTGEEAYSIAICLHEYFSDKTPPAPIQIFATDISEASIAKARSGLYKKQDMAGVSEHRIKQYFIKTDGSYQVNKIIRGMVVFAAQNFLKDPPFGRIDLVSCRNVLIYMEPHLQKKALATFHYALNNNGFLLLGKSETPGLGSPDFKMFNQQHKLYTKNAAAGKYMHAVIERSEAAIKRKDNSTIHLQKDKDDLQKAADDAILSTYVKVGAIVNEHSDVVQFRGSTGSYLEAPPGKITHNIIKLAREGLAFELRNALHKVKTTNKAIRKEGIPLDKGKRLVNIEVIPLQNTIEAYFLVLFEDNVKAAAPPVQTDAKILKKSEEKKLTAEHLRIEQLEKELAQAREDVRAIIEDQEAANEELQSANEELLSGSEELQSLNEELETSKEEIQSANEELNILNQELIERNEQLIHSRKYAEAIVTTIHEPLLILTNDFHIKSANKSFYEKFTETEQQTVGKLFFEISGGKWNIPELKERLQKILPDQSHFENFEVLVHLPYEMQRTMALNARQLINENINEQLILLAFQDRTEQKELEQKLEWLVQERTQELKEANVELQQSNENLQQFASIASHDLQEPLRKIRTFATLLQQRFTQSLSDEGKEVVTKIRISADHMSQLIEEVREYSKIAHATKAFVQTDLDAILKAVLYDLDLLLSETGTVINYKEPLPVIHGIPLQMHQLFYNLLTNAIKFRKEATPPVATISFRVLTSQEIKDFTSLRENLSYIEITFSDNGIGFEQQFADQIFQIFERLHSADEYEGTGVGLALCQKIVENHHGHIFALSKEGEGAEFHVILPVNH